MQAKDFVREARSYQPELPPPHLLQLVSYKEELVSDAHESENQNAVFRVSVLHELHQTLSPEDRALLCFLLEQEIAYHESAWGFFESIRFCAFLLSLLAHVEDVYLLWEAKTTSFDTMCGLDVQLLVGAGVSTTLEYLQQIEEKWAQEASEYIEECLKTGDFRDLELHRNGMHAHFRTMEASE